MNPELPLLAGMGAGARHEDDGLSYMPMPREMNTFNAPLLPESEILEQHPQVLRYLEHVQIALECWPSNPQQTPLVLDDLPEVAVRLIQQILGEGEVSIQLQGPQPARIQETLLAGLWWVQQLDPEGHPIQQWLEVADIPALVSEHSFAGARWPLVTDLPEGLVNAGPVLIELLEAADRQQTQSCNAGLHDEPHVVNLSLLPFSPPDHQFLAQYLGIGPALILSRGYGNCRIQSTATPGIWRVQYFNSGDQLILDTLEVTSMPQVACAAAEDLADSAERLREMREVLL